MKRFDAMSFREKEQLCEMAFSGCGPLWHLYTDGNAQPILFLDAAELKVGMNLFGVCVVSTPGVKIYTFELMNNHLHSVVEGEETAVKDDVEVTFSEPKKYSKFKNAFNYFSVSNSE